MARRIRTEAVATPRICVLFIVRNMIVGVGTVGSGGTAARVKGRGWRGERSRDSIGIIPAGMSVIQVITISMRGDIMLCRNVITAEILGRAEGGSSGRTFLETSRVCRKSIDRTTWMG